MKKIEADHFKHFKQPRALHADGAGNLFYILRRVAEEEDQYEDSLCRISVRDDGTAEYERNFQNGFTFLHWLSPDELVVKDEQGDCFTYSPERNEYSQLISVRDVDIQKIRRIGPNAYLILGKEMVEFDPKFLIADEYPLQTNGTGCRNKIRNSLFLYKECVLKKLTSEKLDVYGFDVFQRDYVIFYGCEFDAVRPTTSRIYKMNIDCCEIAEIENLAQFAAHSAQYIYTSVSVIDRDRILLVRSDRLTYGEYQDEYLDELHLKTGKIRRLNGDSRYHLYDDINTDVTPGIPFAVDFTVVGDEVFFTSTVNHSCHLMVGNFKTGEIKEVTKAPGKVMEFIVHEDKIFMIAMRNYCGAELYEVDRKTACEKKRTNINTSIKEYEFFSPASFSFLNSDGLEIDGWIMKPSVLEKGEKAPAILYIHGGPNTAYGYGYSHEMQFFCQLGYGIIYCNPRGSIGKGPEFADLRGKYGTVDYMDLMEFVEAAVKKCTWIDKARLGVTGGSYGGYMTNWIIGHTDLFKAAVSNRSTANNLSDFFLSEIGFTFVPDTYGVTPWNHQESLWDGSPIKYAPKIKTPALFIQGGEDSICTKDQAIQMFAALKYFGVPSRLMIVGGEDHGFTVEGTPSARIRRLYEMKEWFEKYLLENNVDNK